MFQTVKNILKLQPGACGAVLQSQRNVTKTAVRLSRYLTIGSCFIRFDLIHFSSFNKPTHQNDLPRPAGIASFMRLPISNLKVSLILNF